MQWPIKVTAETLDSAGRRHQIRRTVEGIENVEAAMLRAVLAQKHPGLWLGCEITAVTPIGQKISRVVEYVGGEYVLVPAHGRV